MNKAMSETDQASDDLHGDGASGFLTDLTAVCGDDVINLDAGERAYYSQDLYSRGAVPVAVLRPHDAAEVQNIVKVCARHRAAIHSRGGGMSYTDAFQPQGEHSIILDTAGMDTIREVSLRDGHVVVEAGCTWAALDTELEKHGMRARFWGPMSGGKATIGGSMSQGTVTFGSGTTGASANAVKSFEIVTGEGALIHTGSDSSRNTGPFNRNFGPDITGIFANDAGAMGIKTAITLEIEPRPAKVSGLSFACDDFDGMSALFGDICNRRLASELIAMDGAVARQNAGPANMFEDAKAMWAIGKAAGNPLSALGRMFNIARGGRRFLDKAKYTAHFVVEGRDADELNSRVRAIRLLAGNYSFAEIVNTVPLMTRAMPFPMELAVTHPDGRRMIPFHGVLPYSAAPRFHAAYQKLKQKYAAEMADKHVEIAEFFAGVAGAGILYEPVLYWRDSRTEFHDRNMPSYLQDSIQDYAENTDGRALVDRLMNEVIVLMGQHGATHFQIGKLYPYMQNKTGAAEAFLRDLKARLDPENIINPGALGF